jgi:hypothetical protein
VANNNNYAILVELKLHQNKIRFDKTQQLEDFTIKLKKFKNLISLNMQENPFMKEQ